MVHERLEMSRKLKFLASHEFDTLNWPLSMLIWPHL